MKIIIDQNDGEFNGEVDGDEAKITSDPNISLSTMDLSTCVGLVFIEKHEEVIKRGLAHIHYRPEVLTREVNHKNDYTMIPTKDEIRIIKPGLDEFLSNFKYPRAIAVFNSFKKSKIGNLENPLANWIMHYLIGEKVIFHFPGNFADTNLAGKVQDTRTRVYEWGDFGGTDYKNIGLQESQLIVQHMKYQRDKNHNILPGSKSLAIETFPLDVNF